MRSLSTALAAVLGHSRYFNLFHCNYEQWRRWPRSSALHVRRTALQPPVAAVDSNGVVRGA
jgi:hypothetical protein